MKDIPIFTGQFGIGTLILREIPYKKCAYVMVRGTKEGMLTDFLKECRQFCTMAGAEWILATADEPLVFLPHVHDMLELTCRKEILPPPLKPVDLEPVTMENGAEFLRHYNGLFRTIPNAATYAEADLQRILSQEQACLAMVDGQIAGIGEWTDNELCAIGVLSEFRGLGQRLALTILQKMHGEVITLRVSSSNSPALRLYGKLGFDRSRVLSSWYALKEGEPREEQR